MAFKVDFKPSKVYNKLVNDVCYNADCLEEFEKQRLVVANPFSYNKSTRTGIVAEFDNDYHLSNEDKKIDNGYNKNGNNIEYNDNGNNKDYNGNNDNGNNNGYNIEYNGNNNGYNDNNKDYNGNGNNKNGNNNDKNGNKDYNDNDNRV